ncbi:hypothetical protein [Lachnoclostridium sp. An169]|uniref:hypothetical protein n=1 Tax=Lachnoclostridium sp. An169 TaxID=1965569 RepID=UPI0013A60554|nr:hypothetical protein [Lachnoclostridium sp. An169]HJA66603.1 hypothetical protein [Candidatus Mediterraneibacter cottocaccae]
MAFDQDTGSRNPVAVHAQTGGDNSAGFLDFIVVSEDRIPGELKKRIFYTEYIK